MAKDKEVKAQVASEENIQDVINCMGVVTEDQIKDVQEKIEKARKEKLDEKAKDILLKMDYIQKSTLLSLRRQRRSERKITDYLKAMTAIVDEIKSGKRPVTDFDSELVKLKSNLDKDLREIGNDIDESQNKLNELFPDSWNYRWGTSRFIPNKN